MNSASLALFLSLKLAVSRCRGGQAAMTNSRDVVTKSGNDPTKLLSNGWIGTASPKKASRGRVKESMTQEDDKKGVPPLMEAAALLIRAAPKHTLLTVNLNKALFYFDLHVLLETGKTATGATFVALQNGPVVESYQNRLVGGLERLGIAMQDDDDPNYKPVILTHDLTTLQFSGQVQAIAFKVGEWASSKSARQLIDYSHSNAGWLVAWGKEGEGLGRAINMRVAMQQLAEDDPWLGEALTDEERAAFAGADDGEAIEW